MNMTHSEKPQDSTTPVSVSDSGYSAPRIFELGGLNAIKLEWHGVDVDGSGGWYNRREG